ncbi:MAG: hypothetical protein GWN21_03315 [Gammaproteobacteria bacterium]|nr:hypothetical protein [Gammaproteobacteria bacterium]NIP87928.1 hypothetical protein [Gammaproteobacteria bacterium]NIR22086.1 hypothetical protein [Gammaproteobacteria bacterium]NIS03768.1 hypothetical protein [Gammaproteobacteria bacterium]NIU42208.1 hypothetical protein [Gammaproteobacteria bacterium]
MSALERLHTKANDSRRMSVASPQPMRSAADVRFTVPVDARRHEHGMPR